MNPDYSFTCGYPLPDSGLYGLCRGFDGIRIEFTNNCTFKCFCCPHTEMKRAKGIMSQDDLRLLLDKVKEALPLFQGEIQVLGFGEALLLNDLPQRLEIIKAGYPGNTLDLISTFGVKKYSYGEIDRLLATGLDEVHISCYGYDRETYKKIHGVDAFDIVIHNIRHLAALREKYNLHLHVKYDDFIVYPQNREEHVRARNKFLDFCRQEGVVLMDANRLNNLGETKIFVEAAGQKSPRHACSVVWGFRARELVVYWNLDIVPCSIITDGDIILGNLREQSLDDIFSSARYIDFYNRQWSREVEDIPACRFCDFPNDDSSADEISRMFHGRMQAIVEASALDKEGEVLPEYAKRGDEKKVSGLQGWVDYVAPVEQGRVRVSLWAADETDGAPLARFHVYVNGRRARIVSAACEGRGDVRDVFKNVGWKHAGVILDAEVIPSVEIRSVRVIAENSRGEKLLLGGGSELQESIPVRDKTAPNIILYS
jgi:radical SAM protein with 4Fe4S-binding SPASM domain